MTTTAVTINRLIVQDLCQRMLCVVDIAAGALLDEGHSMPEVQAALHMAADMLPELQAELEAEDQ